MRLRQLQYFVTICESRSFSAAADRLLVAQPSLSQQVKALEKEVGAELLERSRHGLALTPAGRVFLPHALAILKAAEDATAAVRNVLEGREGDVHVLTVRSIASGVLPTSIARWHALYPMTVLRLHDYSHRRDLEQAVRSNIGDMAIGPRPLNWDGPITSLGFEELVIVGPDADSAAASAPNPITVDDLAKANWVLYEEEQGMSEVVGWLAGSLGFTPRAVARTGQVAAAMSLAVEGVGLALVPENAVPRGWAPNARRIGAGAYREIVCYTREDPPQLARRYLDLLASVELPLNHESEVPRDALRC